MEPWRDVLRRGILPAISTNGLLALRDALVRDDPCLVQSHTTVPPCVPGVLDWPVESACPVSYTGWKGDGLNTVEAVHDYFVRILDACDAAMEDVPAAAQWFLRWVDETPRAEMLSTLFAEVELALVDRAAQEDTRAVVVNETLGISR